ncbi:MAG TPA: serine hydrolase [Acidimicrobiales bacterium]|nr:serine hydrolase [Acidimicrobiales bacterium]
MGKGRAGLLMVSLAAGCGAALAPPAAGAAAQPARAARADPAPPGPLVHAASAGGGNVYALGGARRLGSLAGDQLSARLIGIAATPDGLGYWLASSDGGVFNFGDARFDGSAGGSPLAEPVVGMASTISGHGYWLAAGDGGIFSYGDARFLGSAGGLALAEPVVGMAPTPDGGGYWLVASDGGIFSYGDARFRGSAGGMPLTAPIVAMAATHDGRGYWLFAADGGVFSYGDAEFLGSAAGRTPQPVVGAAATRDGKGYWLVNRTGGVFHFGDAAGAGSPAGIPTTSPAVGMAPAASGYWVAQRGPYSTPFTPQLISYLQTMPETTTAAVEDLDTGIVYTYDPGPSLVLGSTVKVQILATLLSQAQAGNRPLTATEQHLATAMIEVSDNSAAAQLFAMVGGAAAIQAWDDSIGLTGTFVYTNWGESTSTATDELTLLHVYIAPNRYLSEPYRTYGLYLLGHVEVSQIFGINTGPPESAVLAAKTGRIPGSGVSNSIGWVKGQGRNYLVAVLTQYGLSDQGDLAAEEPICYDAWITLGP